MSFQEAIAQQAQWVQVWMNVLLAGAFILPLTLLLWKELRVAGMITALASVAAGTAITWMYGAMGYVKLLGLPHIVVWLPLVYFLVGQARRTDMPAWPKRIICVIVVVLCVSLAFDILGTVQYLLGDRAPTILPE